MCPSGKSQGGACPGGGGGSVLSPVSSYNICLLRSIYRIH